MENRLRQALARAEEVARLLADPETARSPARLKELGREHARLGAIQQTHDRLNRLQTEVAQARELLGDTGLCDPDIGRMAELAADRARAHGHPSRARDALELAIDQWTRLGRAADVDRATAALDALG